MPTRVSRELDLLTILRPLIPQYLNLKGRLPSNFHLAFPIPICDPILVALGGCDPKGQTGNGLPSRILKCQIEHGAPPRSRAV